MSGTGLESRVSVGDSTSSVVVEVSLDVTADDTTKGSYEVVDLTRVGAANSVGNTDTVDTDLVDGAVDGEQVDELGTERVLGRETDLNTLGLDKLDD